MIPNQMSLYLPHFGKIAQDESQTSLDTRKGAVLRNLQQHPGLGCRVWGIIKICLHIAPNRTPNIDCYWVGAVPKV